MVTVLGAKMISSWDKRGAVLMAINPFSTEGWILLCHYKMKCYLWTGHLWKNIYFFSLPFGMSTYFSFSFSYFLPPRRRHLFFNLLYFRIQFVFILPSHFFFCFSTSSASMFLSFYLNIVSTIIHIHFIVSLDFIFFFDFIFRR